MDCKYKKDIVIKPASGTCTHVTWCAQSDKRCTDYYKKCERKIKSNN